MNNDRKNCGTFLIVIFQRPNFKFLRYQEVRGSNPAIKLILFGGRTALIFNRSTPYNYAMHKMYWKIFCSEKKKQFFDHFCVPCETRTCKSTNESAP